MHAKDTFGSIGCEDMDTSRLLRSLAEVLEKLVASEAADAVEQARAQAHSLLAEMRPLIGKTAHAPDWLRDGVRQHPLLALGIAGLAGFMLASLKRK
jgi:ElaB/YqjD/DUF883 family membrane-anchored ribosome-binding protein